MIRRSPHDFTIWREQMKTVDNLGAAIVSCVTSPPRTGDWSQCLA